MTEPVVGHLSDRGLHPDRPVNEDAFFVPEGLVPGLVAERGWLYVVSDGMGGEAAGEVASRIGVDAFKEYYYHRQWAGSPDKMLTQAAHAASDAVLVASGQPGRKGMGATLTALALQNDRAYVANLGDSRCYLVRNGAITQMTEDHTFVARMVRKGLMTQEEARTSPKRNIISRYLGMDDPKPDLSEHALRGGDIFLLATDGVHGVLSDEELRDLVLQHPPDRAVIEVIEKVKSRGAPDNATIIVVKVGDVKRDARKEEEALRVLPAPADASAKPKLGHRRRLRRGAALAGFVVLALLVIFAVRKYLPHPHPPMPAPAKPGSAVTQDSLTKPDSNRPALPTLPVLP